MERYRSAGVATIAALMAADRPGDPGARPASALSQGWRARAIGVAGQAPPAATGGIAGDARGDFSRIVRRCERAVLTAYCDLRAHGTGEAAALRACATLYRLHHPHASPSAALCLVGGWIDHHLRRGEAGPTRGCACD